MVNFTTILACLATVASITAALPLRRPKYPFYEKVIASLHIRDDSNPSVGATGTTETTSGTTGGAINGGSTGGAGMTEAGSPLHGQAGVGSSQGGPAGSTEMPGESEGPNDASKSGSGPNQNMPSGSNNQASQGSANQPSRAGSLGSQGSVNPPSPHMGGAPQPGAGSQGSTLAGYHAVPYTYPDQGHAASSGDSNNLPSGSSVGNNYPQGGGNPGASPNNSPVNSASTAASGNSLYEHSSNDSSAQGVDNPEMHWYFYGNQSPPPQHTRHGGAAQSSGHDELRH